MPIQMNPALVLRDEDGTLYLLPREVLERYRVAEAARVELEQIVLSADVEGFGAPIRMLGLVAAGAMLIPALAGHPVAVHADVLNIDGSLQLSGAYEGPTTEKNAAAAFRNMASPSPYGALTTQKDPAAEYLGDLTEPLDGGWPQLSISTQGEVETVRSLQYLLLAYYGGRPQFAVDGKFGPQTRAAVVTFQEAKAPGVDATGIVGAKEWPDLLVSVKLGDHGPAVQAVQSQLQSRGVAVAVSGVFDAQTEAAVKAYQGLPLNRGLKVGGVVDHETWQALLVGV